MAKAAATESATVLEGASPADGVESCRAKELQMVDLQFTGLPGRMQPFSIPAEHSGPQGGAYDDGKNPGFRFTV